jgi:hypothetical protein
MVTGSKMMYGFIVYPSAAMHRHIELRFEWRSTGTSIIISRKRGWDDHRDFFLVTPVREARLVDIEHELVPDAHQRFGQPAIPPGDVLITCEDRARLHEHPLH